MTTGIPANVSGERIGTWTAVAPTGETNRYTGTRVWSLRCDCGLKRIMCLSDFRQYQRRGKAPRCHCQTQFALKRAKPLARAPRKPSMVSAPRVSSKVCWLCCGLSHRVAGIKCRECGLRFAREAPVALDVTGLGSSAGQLEKYALGGDKHDAQNRRPRKVRAA